MVWIVMNWRMLNAQCEVGSSGKYRVLKIEGKRFLQIGTTYFGEVEDD